VFDHSKLVGALVMGNQSTADPLRALIEADVDATALLPYLEADWHTLAQEIQKLWEQTVALQAAKL
jgi:hypothetical protein